MQHPIGEHALLADSRTAALIDPDGNVAWLCWPWIDATPLLFSILDAGRGGEFSVRPARADARVVTRRYHPRSLVLETVWEVGAARLIVEDALDLGEVTLLVRSVRAEGESVDVLTTVRAPSWPGAHSTLRAFGTSLEIHGAIKVVVHAPSPWEATDDRTVSRITLDPGRPVIVTLGTADASPAEASITETLFAWHRAVPEIGASVAADVPHATDLLGTTAAVLVGLRRRDGGIVAAPTTSLPQWPGTGRTWDYRYCWLRDSSLAALAMLRLGLTDPARSLGAFIGSVVIESGPIPLVRVDGSAPPEETEPSGLAGYGGARPVRIGNAAAGQPQLDVPGEVIQLASSLAECSALDGELATAVTMLARWLVDHRSEPDHGIWEIRGAPARYTHSLVTALSGLEGAAGLADRNLVQGDAAVWRQAATAIAKELAATPGPLQIHLDGGGADAALAQMALLGGLESIALRTRPTLDLIVRRLGHSGLLDRHEAQADTLVDPCAPFVFPTFWIAEALAAIGGDGSRWLDAAVSSRGSLGLFGEVVDPRDHSPLGNYPQVQSHATFALAVVSAPR
jgi:GH15 family glucan-1,4-alpha-glucosidase